MYRLIYLLLILFPFLNDVQGQSIYSLQQEGLWQFNYSGGRKADQYTNQVLKQLGLAHLKIPEKTNFTFYYSYGASVGFQQRNQLDLSISLTPKSCAGDVTVREFDMQKMLVPTSCNFGVSVINPLNRLVFQTERENVALNDLLAGITVTSFPDSVWSAGCSVRVEFNRFRFDEPTYKSIERELYAIRDYDAAASLADSLEKTIRQVRIMLHTPQEAFRTYIFCNKALYLLGEAAKTQTIIVPGNDPGRLLPKIPVLKYQTQDLVKFLIEEGIDGPLSGNVYLIMAKGFGYALKDALSLSQKVDYYSSPFYYRLYSNSTSASQFLEARKVIWKYAEYHKLKPVDYKQLSLRIINEYMTQGEQLMTEGRYSEAVDLLITATKFCRLNPAVFVPLKLTAETNRARSGLMDSYVRIVQKALDNNLPALADKYLTEAMQYASRSGNMNAGDSEGFAGLYQVLSGNNIKSGNKLLNQGNFKGALEEFDKAYRIATQFNLSVIQSQAEDGQNEAVNGIFHEYIDNTSKALNKGNVESATALIKEALEFVESYPSYKPDMFLVASLDYQIKIAIYNKLIGDASDLAIAADYEGSVNKLIAAAEISHQNHFSNSRLYDSLVMIAAVPSINTLFADGRLKHWSGDPESALKLAYQAVQIASALGIGNRQDFKDQFGELMSLADETICNQVKGELSSLINRAGICFSENKFGEAAGLVKQARELIYSKAGCGLNTVELNKLTDKYQYPVRWNELIKAAAEHVTGGDLTKGIETMQQASSVFEYYRLDTLGLINTGLFDLAMATDDFRLISHVTGYYIMHGGYDQAMLLLERLHKTGANAEQTNDLQESLARVLAKRDLAETEMPDIKVMLNTYTGGSKWYKRFTEVYKYHIENR